VPEIIIWGCSPGGCGDGSSLEESTVEVPVGGFFVPQKLKQFADIVYRFRPQKRSKIETVGLADTLILDQSVSLCGRVVVVVVVVVKFFN